MKHQIFAFAILLFSNTAVLGLPIKNFSCAQSEEKSPPFQKMGDGGFAGGIVITINPNPTFGKTTITLTSELPVQVELRLLDAAGNQVSILPGTQLSSGANQMNVNFNGYPSGIYILLLVTPGSTILKKIVFM